MESVVAKEPKDDQITNKDRAVTNKDGDNNTGKGEKSATQEKQGKDMTEISDNDSIGVLADENASNKGQGPAGENL